MIREIDPDDFLASGQIRRGEQPRHCGQPARYEDSGIWECSRCGASGYTSRPGGPIQWQASNYSPIDYGRN